MRQLAVMLFSAALFCTAFAQGPNAADLPKNAPVIAKLPPTSYPPIALAAHVWGLVDLYVTVHPDGTVASADVVSGPAMLRDAAIESAKQTQFQCPGCAASGTRFRIIFKYELAEAYYCDPPDKSYPKVSQNAGIITFAGQPAGTCDPMGTVEKVRVRSAKCLFLWKCGLR
jgi:TonB family protein